MDSDGRYWARINPVVELLGLTLLDFSRLLQGIHSSGEVGLARLSTTEFDSALGQIRDMLQAVRAAAGPRTDDPGDTES